MPPMMNATGATMKKAANGAKPAVGSYVRTTTKKIKALVAANTVPLRKILDAKPGYEFLSMYSGNFPQTKILMATAQSSEATSTIISAFSRPIAAVIAPRGKSEITFIKKNAMRAMMMVTRMRRKSFIKKI
jgi:IMP cyclohydrolase